MFYLLLDTTNGLTIGLLNNKLEWINYYAFEEKKPSEVIHFKINEILELNNVNLKDITLITVAGPGSYTGMRLSEGISNIFMVCGIKTMSFFHFEVPLLLGVNEGCFVTNAFKGQYFNYSWKNNKVERNLVNNTEMNFSKKVYTNIHDNKFIDSISTSKLILENNEILFKKVIERGTCEKSFYFRALDEEFKTVC
jgi:tRNA threonylcarbamoyladenosine biosynthesis protein TsaB